MRGRVGRVRGCGEVRVLVQMWLGRQVVGWFASLSTDLEVRALRGEPESVRAPGTVEKRRVGKRREGGVRRVRAQCII